MSASLPTAAGTAPRGSILLIEEYDALAVAIDSALKKFAPRHTTSVARTVAEARAFADQSAPELVVIDADPPPSAITEFLHELQKARPEARALIIAPGVTDEIAAERRAHGALQFIGKPFEVAVFGAAVQALLGPWRENGSAISRRTLRDLSPADVVVLHCASGSSVALKMNAGSERTGEIQIVGGQIFDAATGDLRGEAALDEMLSWFHGRIKETAEIARTSRTIHGPWTSVFLAAANRQSMPDPESSIQSETPSQEAPGRKDGKKVVVIDDTEMLLIFVEDVLATAEPTLEITTALEGAIGLKEVARLLPDLVILDYSLPDLNGDEVCRQLLQNERTAQVPVLMMSAHVPEMAAAAARLGNIVATIEKPFMSDQLVDLVRRVMTMESPAVTSAKALASNVFEDEAKRPADSQKLRQSAGAVVPARRSEKPESGALLAQTPTFFAPTVSNGTQDIVLGLFLEVLSMQFTPQLQMGTVRVRPSSLAVSLHVSPAAVRETLPLRTGFQLGRTELDKNGQITVVRVIPSLQPFKPALMRNGFEIADVAVRPAQGRDRVELIPAAAATMTIQLLVNLELAGVELSPSFEVAQLILKWRSNAVRVTLSSNGIENGRSGTAFEAAAVQLDNSARIAEMLLNPVR